MTLFIIIQICLSLAGRTETRGFEKKLFRMFGLKRLEVIYQRTNCIMRRFQTRRYVPLTRTYKWEDMIFVYCNWVSTRWQWSVNLYKNRKETAIYERRNNTENNTKHRTHKIENKRKKNIKNQRWIGNIERVAKEVQVMQHFGGALKLKTKTALKTRE
jgi:hypothetical protein